MAQYYSDDQSSETMDETKEKIIDESIQQAHAGPPQGDGKWISREDDECDILSMY